MTFDFDSFNTKDASEQGAEVEIIHPETGPTGLFIRVKGPHSSEVRAQLGRIRLRAQAASKGTFRKDDEQEGPEFLATITIGWRTADGSPVKLLGEDLPFSKDNAIKVYTNYSLIADQVAAFVFQPTNFLKG